MPNHSRVFLPGDPLPGPEVQAVVDNKGEIWSRRDADTWLSPGGQIWTWRDALVYGPLVECEPLPNYRAAVAADAKRREEK
jgi:hypothetical protein